MLSVQQMQTPTVFSDDQMCGNDYQVSYDTNSKQEVISSSEDDDSYDELDMYENIGDFGRVTCNVSPLESKPESVWPLVNKVEESNVAAKLPKLRTQEELDENKAKLVKKKKFRKVRCSKLADRRRSTMIEANGMHLDAEQAAENDRLVIEQESETYQVETTETHIMIQEKHENTPHSSQNTRINTKQIKRKTQEAGISFSLQANKRKKGGDNGALQSNDSNTDDTFEPMNHEVTITEFHDNGLTNQDITVDFKQLLDEVKFSEIDQNGLKVYQCRVCSKIVDNRNKLKHHNSIHNRESAYLEKHNCTKIKGKNDVDIYQCVVCSQQKTSRRQMISHHKSCSGENKARLKLKQFLERFNFTKIMQDERDMYQCNVCSKITKDRQKARDHYTIHTGERSYKCQECGESFRLESTLRAHTINKHSTERNYICSICNKTYKHASYLRTHMNIHTKTRFKCDMCGSDYSAIQTLKEHIMYKHLGLRSVSSECPSTSLTTCIVCQKTFANSFTLNLHMQTHDGTQKFDCDICGAFFSRRTDRDRHRMRHTGQRPFKCNECDYGCITRGELNTHMLQHTDRSGGQARHKCPYCDKTLIRKIEMTGHIAKEHLSVESVKKTSFCCIICDVCFVSRYELNIHNFKVHQKTFDCAHCDRTFSTASNRNRHIERVHLQKPVACNVCKKTFKSKANLYDHCRLVHPGIRNLKSS